MLTFCSRSHHEAKYARAVVSKHPVSGVEHREYHSAHVVKQLEENPGQRPVQPTADQDDLQIICASSSATEEDFNSIQFIIDLEGSHSYSPGRNIVH